MYRYTGGVGVLASSSDIKRIAAVALATEIGRIPICWMADIGCGEGALAVELARRLQIKRLLMADIDPDLVRTACTRVNTESCGGATQGLVADIDHLGLRRWPTGIGLVVLSHVLYYSQNWRAALSNLSHVPRFGDVWLAAIVRTPESCSRLVRDWARGSAEGRTKGLDSSDVRVWFERKVPHRTELAVQAYYYPAIDTQLSLASLRSFRSVLTYSREFHSLLSLWCHTEPLALSDERLGAILVGLRGMIVGESLMLRVEDQLFLGSLSTM
jgi:hypothetical protein